MGITQPFFVQILMKIHTFIYEFRRPQATRRAPKILVFEYVPVIWHNWAKKGPDMGTGGRLGSGTSLKFGHRS